MQEKLIKTEYFNMQEKAVQTLNLIPRPFQEEAIDILEKNDGNALISLDMGLGKTLVSIAYAIRNNLKTLAVVPAKLKYNWRNEIMKIAGITAGIIGEKKDYDENVDYQFRIISYEVLKKYRETILSLNLDLIILDESHYIKSYKATRTKESLILSKFIKRRCLLTGTPVLSYPRDLYTQLQTIQPNMFPSFIYFGNRYCGPSIIRNSKGKEITLYNGYANLKELYGKIKPFYFRRKKEDVLDNLPEKVIQIIPIKISDKAKEEEKLVYEDFVGYLKDVRQYDSDRIDKVLSAEPLVKAGILNQIYAMDKARGITKELTDNELYNGRKVVIFTWFTGVVRILKNTYKDIAVTVTGEDSAEKAFDKVNRLQNDDNVRILIGNIETCSEGFNMTTSNICIFNDTTYVPSKIKQAYSRLHRMGQKNRVYVYLLKAKDTYEEEVFSILEKKENIIDQIVEGNFEDGYSDAINFNKEIEETMINYIINEGRRRKHGKASRHPKH